MAEASLRDRQVPIRESWVLVTGAAAGVGEATSRVFAQRGARLILADWDRKGVDALASDLQKQGAEALSYGVDVSDRAAMTEFADWVHTQVEAVDVLVNNAGVLEVGGLEDSSFERWDELLGINLMGVVHGCKLFMPSMRQRGRGAVVNLAAASGMVGLASMTAFSTSKFAVVGLSQAIRAEYYDHGVVVSVVCPALIDTEIWNDERLEDKQRQEIADTLSRRGVSRQAVADAVVMAAEKGRAIVPVGVEATAMDWMGRLLPSQASHLASRLSGID